MTSYTINAILEKTENRDKDFRYMAISDLLTGARLWSCAHSVSKIIELSQSL